VYLLVERGAYVGDRHGRLRLDATLTRGVWADMVSRALGLDLAVDDPTAPVPARVAAQDVPAYLPARALEAADETPLTQADGAHLLVGALAPLEVLAGW